MSKFDIWPCLKYIDDEITYIMRKSKVETPLAELSEALDDDTEADKFLGDPMFWRHAIGMAMH